MFLLTLKAKYTMAKRKVPLVFFSEIKIIVDILQKSLWKLVLKHGIETDTEHCNEGKQINWNS